MCVGIRFTRRGPARLQIAVARSVNCSLQGVGNNSPGGYPVIAGQVPRDFTCLPYSMIVGEIDPQGDIVYQGQSPGTLQVVVGRRFENKPPLFCCIESGIQQGEVVQGLFILEVRQQHQCVVADPVVVLDHRIEVSDVAFEINDQPLPVNLGAFGVVALLHPGIHEQGGQHAQCNHEKFDTQPSPPPADFRTHFSISAYLLGQGAMFSRIGY